MPSLDDLRTLTVEDVAEVLGVRPEAVRIWAREGRLPAYKVGKRLRFRAQAVDEFLESLRLVVPDVDAFVRQARERRIGLSLKRKATAGAAGRKAPALEQN